MKILQSCLFFAFVSLITCISMDTEPIYCGLNQDERRNRLNFLFTNGNGNVETVISNHPWTVSILKYEGKSRRRHLKIHCGGSLISTKHILTASHCMHDQKNEDSMVKKEDLRVILGATDPLFDGFEFEVKDYATHPKFTYPKAYFDVSIVELTKSVTFGFDIFPICLPKLAITDENKWKGLPATMSGYGSKTGTQTQCSESNSATLHYAKLSVLEHQDCTKKHYDDLIASNSEESMKLQEKVRDILSEEKFTSELICSLASSEELGTCPGDSGGPLVHYNEENGMNFQIGVVFGSLQVRIFKSTLRFLLSIICNGPIIRTGWEISVNIQIYISYNPKIYFFIT